jgi:hypothetical protein
LFRNVGKKLTIIGCIISHKSSFPIYFAAEAWNHAWTKLVGCI